MKLVIRVGGSVVASPFNPVLMNAYVELLIDLKRQRHLVAAVVGGGSISRELIKTARAMGLSEAAQDEVAISVSRLMAQLFVLRLGNHGSLTVPTTIEDAGELLKKGIIVVMGGLKPGMTTDTVAAMLAECVDADLLVKATDVDGIFTQDPKRYKEAKKLERLSFDDLFSFFEKQRHEAGIHQVLDPEAIRILQKKRIKTVIVNGFRSENVLLAVKGERVGTLIE
jgi:uridylate kinase